MLMHKIITIVMREDLYSHLIKILLILRDATERNCKLLGLDFAFLSDGFWAMMKLFL